MELKFDWYTMFQFVVNVFAEKGVIIVERCQIFKTKFSNKNFQSIQNVTNNSCTKVLDQQTA